MSIPLKITVYHGSELAGEHRFERDIVKIGRLSSAHLRLDDNKVSRIHAVIEASSDGQDYSVIDMGSTEGTYLNGERVSKEKLSDGDELRLGDCRLLIAFEEANASERPGAAAVSAPPASRNEPLWAASPSELAAANPTMTLSAASPFDAAAMAVPFAAPQASGVAPGGGAFVQGGAHAAMGIPVPMPQQVMMGAQGMVVQQGGIPMVAAMQMPTQPTLQMHPQAIPQLPTAGMTVPQQAYASAQSAAAMAPMGAAPQSSPPPMIPADPWGSAPNNLASENVPDTDRAFEIKALWGKSHTTVLDSLTVTTQPTVTMGDERRVTGWGPFQKIARCDIEIPSKQLPSKTWPIAMSHGGEGTNYTINVPGSFDARLQRADGAVLPLEQLRKSPNAEPGDANGFRYNLRAAETLYLFNGDLIFQLRYIRQNKLIPPGLWAEMNYSWLNILILAFFVHLMGIVSFLAMPRTTSELTEDIFKNPNRFAQFRLTPEEKKKAEKNDMLAKLKEGAAGAKAKGTEGKAGKKDYDPKKKQGRMAVKGDPNDKEIAKSTLQKLFGGKGNVGRSYLFGSGGLGGELKGALGGVTGAEIGDATGLGGLGTRGTGPGGGGLSMNSVGLGALGTHGRGGGGSGTGYGEGAGGLGKKVERDINISAGSPIIMGSLDKELIRRVIQQHIAQIRYCYEKELVRSPGLFGKVATQFTISAEGDVSDARVEQSTMNNGEVERCITSKIRTWKFPKPKGGGVVIVKYPFLFKTTG